MTQSAHIEAQNHVKSMLVNIDMLTFGDDDEHKFSSVTSLLTFRLPFISIRRTSFLFNPFILSSS